MAENNLWSSFIFSKKEEKSALDILEEFKDGLSKTTGGELRLEVEAVDGYINEQDPIIAGIYTLYVVAPRLGHFRRKILVVADYDDKGPFPVDVVNSYTGAKKEKVSG